MITCILPEYCREELTYTIKYIFSRVLDCDIVFDYKLTDQVVVSSTGYKKLFLSASFFKNASANWLEQKSLPTKCDVFECDTPLFQYSKSFPVLYGKPDIQFLSDHIICEIDILGTIFFMLSRYEEGVGYPTLDEHRRFPSTASVAYKYGFIERPIVDEYIELFRSLVLNLWPSLSLKNESFRQFVTCDVDWPFDPVPFSFNLTLRTSLVDLVRRKNLASAINRWSYFFSRKLRLRYHDDFRERISWIMDVNEKKGNKVAFYFITECTNAKFDSRYSFDSPELRRLLKEINSRGHEIGLHPGYNCFNSPKLFEQSANRLKRVLKEEGIVQPKLGGRMHYLRWDSKVTPKLWEDNGFDYDSTLSFADKAGFRCGTSHSFPMYDLVNRRPLKVVQRPLINMDCTIISPRYENLGHTENALTRFELFKGKVRYHEGEYVLLWHNTYFEHTEDERIYLKLI